MIKYLKADEWQIIEDNFSAQNHRSSESIFSIGNGRMGQRANFEEKYSGKTLQGTYIGGVYYTDKTKVGWWKNGYPEYFAKVLNAPNFTGINIQINGIELDLHTATVEEFTRVLDMKRGTLSRNFIATLENGNRIEVQAERFISMDNKEIAAIKYAIRPLNFTGEITYTPYIDGDVENSDSNYDEKFWVVEQTAASERKGYLRAVTKKTGFHVAVSMRFDIKDSKGNVVKNSVDQVIEEDKYVANVVSAPAQEGEWIIFTKYVAVISSLNHEAEQLEPAANRIVEAAQATGYDTLLEAHVAQWDYIWRQSDICIEGDVEAQQAIRFNIFHLKQTYTGDDHRLNFGPKGFTGEKYGGSTYWDTEAYCIAFCLGTSDSEITRNLLKYRHNHLDRAIENAGKLGFTNGAALYPMVTMNGEECHNEWEITFEEIHRNGAIAYAVYKYVEYTGDEKYLEEYGMDVLVGIARFWAQRVNHSGHKGQYVILGVTGPNEYENNVNNNWYTNKIAAWCLRYALEAFNIVKEANPTRYNELTASLNFDVETEGAKWQDIIDNMYYPYNEELDVFMQQDGFMDKEQLMADELDDAIRPINQHWSWDRILRSCFIKQADVLQGIYFFEDEYDVDTIRRNFDFYEPRTVHESSLSPCVHSILSAKIGDIERAYRFYLRTSRLDLDDYNHEAHEGLHITSMAGTWMSIVEGFAGMRVKGRKLHFTPQIPQTWKSYSFKVQFRDNILNFTVTQYNVAVHNEKGEAIEVVINGDSHTLESNTKYEI